jgi:hypothetical protein
MVGRYVKEQAADWSRGWRQQRQLATAGHLPRAGVSPILPRMFVVSEEAAAAIELRRHFPGLDNAKALDCARVIAGCGLARFSSSGQFPALEQTRVMALRGDAGPKDHAFRSRKSGALSRMQVHAIFKEIARRAGLPAAASVHWLRHAHVSHCLDNKAPHRIIARGRLAFGLPPGRLSAPGKTGLSRANRTGATYGDCAPCGTHGA